ncbi:MAG: Divergent AAA domain protein, partial [Candidatus Scalindua brodae]
MTFIDYSTADVLTILSRVKSEPSDKIESETIEFKEFSSESSLHGSKELAEEICALANCQGGVLIVGVRDTSNLQSKDLKSQLVGFQEVDTAETEKRINGKLQNLVNLRIENINFEDKNYVAVYVMHNLESLVTTTSGKICIREGRDSRPMTPEEVERAVKSLQNYDWSADILQRVELSALDEEHVKEAFVMYKSLMKQEVAPSKDNFLVAFSLGDLKN